MSTVNCPDCMGSLSISGIALGGPAWCVTDLSPLYETAEVRGTDRLLPSAAGVVAYPRRATVTRVDLNMVIAGGFDRFGVAYTDTKRGLYLNWKFLVDNLVASPGGATGTRSAVLTTPALTTLSGSVHVQRLRPGITPGPYMLAVLELSIPAGALA